MIYNSPRLKKTVYWIIKDTFIHYLFCVEFSSVQFTHSVMSDSLWPHALQHARPPCPSPTPGAYPNSRPLSRWCHPTISSSVIPFSSRLQSFPEWGSFQMNQFFASGGQIIKKRYIYIQSVLCWIVPLQKDMWKSYPPAFMNVIWLGNSFYSFNWVKTRSFSWALNSVKPTSLFEEERNTERSTLWKYREKKAMWYFVIAPLGKKYTMLPFFILYTPCYILCFSFISAHT